jgi:Xaa-Pro aminopeptidase
MPLRQQTELTNSWLRKRLQLILPAVMKRAGLDLWIVTSREYNEAPVLLSLLPAPMMSARRRTVLVFHAPEDGPFEAMAIANAGIGLDGYYQPMWVKTQLADAEETQEDCLGRIVAERNPQHIGVGVSAATAFGDGLSVSDHEWLTEALGPELSERLTSAESVAVGWLEQRLPEEIEAANGINQIAHGIIGEAFSSRVVHPGVTTALDVAWWLRQRVNELGLTCWFHPTVSLQRQGVNLGDIGASPDEIIRHGDLLHCDFGLHYLGLATDTQQNAYVLRLGEDAPPAGIQQALKRANLQQDLLAAQMQAGRSGNEILLGTLTAMREHGITGRIYSHPIGYHGHGAGPMIGRYDRQDSLPGPGEFPLHDDTLFSFEMYLDESVPEWDGQTVKFATEQIAAFTAGRIQYLGGRQTELHLIQ